MDVRCINPFIEGIKNVFSTMLEIDIIIRRPHVKTDEDQTADASAVIGLSGDAVGLTVAKRAAGAQACGGT